MYDKNTIAKRRRSGWSERLRYFRNLFTRVKPTEREREKTPESAPGTKKD